MRDAEEYAAIDLMLSRGVVPIPSTIPPHVHRPALARAYNEALRTLAGGRVRAVWVPGQEAFVYRAEAGPLAERYRPPLMAL
mgnify:CR=1 FL=1